MPSPTTGSGNPDPDPVHVRRARITVWVTLAKRIGYGLLGLAMATFVIAAASGFPSGLLTVTIVALVAACVVLPVPIVLGYGLRAAEREEREEQQARQLRESRSRRADEPGGGEPPETRQ